MGGMLKSPRAWNPHRIPKPTEVYQSHTSSCVHWGYLLLFVHWLSPGYPSQLTAETTNAAGLAENIDDYWQAETSHTASPVAANP